MFSSIGKYDYGQNGILIPNTEITLIDQNGPGEINFIQFAADFEGYEDTLFRIYYNKESTSYTEAYLFNNMWHSSEPRFGSNGKSSFYISIKIPFEDNIRITAELSSSIKDPQFVYWTIRGNTGISSYIGDFKLPQNTRLKLIEKDNLLYPLEDITLANQSTNKGMKGLLYACQLHLTSASFDYLEGRVTFSTNSEEYYIATGIDDYLGSAWWFTSTRGEYNQPGSCAVNKLKNPGEVIGFRIHERDLITWSNSYDFKIRNGDISFDGNILGVPDITQLSSRVWIYEWKE